MSEEKLYNKNSIYTYCYDCKMFGINIPNNKQCGNCNSNDTILYYSENDVDFAVQVRRDNIIKDALKKFNN